MKDGFLHFGRESIFWSTQVKLNIIPLELTFLTVYYIQIFIYFLYF